MDALIQSCAPADRSVVNTRLTLGLHHEQQHQALLLMDIKRNFFSNPLYPEYRPRLETEQGHAIPVRWLEVPGGIREIGHSG